MYTAMYFERVSRIEPDYRHQKRGMGHSSDYVGGNAGDMGEGVSSKLSEPFVGGVCPVGETLPMNQDCEDEDLIHVLHSK
jgi:hypothetical protein